MQRAFALHGVDEGHVVHARGELRKEIAQPAPALPVLPERPEAPLAGTGFRREKLQVPIGIERLAVALRQLRFVVPRIDVAQAARTKNLDYRLGLRGELRRLRRER